jgi:two-component system chemotaxis sensor kinase CheA
VSDPSLLAVFRAEAEEVVGQIVFELERWPELARDVLARSVRNVLRALHNLKGGARLAGVFDAEMVAHLLEGELGAGGLPDAALAARVREGAWLLLDLIDGRASDARVQAFVAGASPSSAEASSPPPSPSSPSSSSPSPSLSPSPSASEPVSLSSVESAAPSTAVARVMSSRLDAVLALASEMPAAVERRAEVVRGLEGLGERLMAGRKTWPSSARAELDEVARELARLTEQLRGLTGARLADELGESLKGLRMQRLEELRPTWQRIVDETCAQLGRQARLELDVGDVELDREVVDRLRDPLMHVLRNAVDHGVGDAATRAARGRDARGLIRITARARGLDVEIVVEDDGAGLDLAAIRRRARALGLVDAETGDGMSGDGLDPALADLVFSPGFSTASEVGAVSGRGVGLDVVRAAAQQLGGSARIGPSGLGGTALTIAVPASVVTTRALVVVAGGAQAAIPIAAVVRVRRVAVGETVVVDGGTAVVRAGAPPLPLRWLAPLLAMSPSGGSSLLVVELDTAAGAVGLVVDDVHGERALVVRAMPWSVGVVRGVIGAAVWHDGRALPVLDPSTLRRAEAAARGAGPAPSTSRTRLLVVDDSLTSRTLQKSILGGAGHEVVLASDGEEAWERLQAGGFDLLVSDVEMPRLDGLELVRRIRRSEAWRTLPVILVTSLERPDEIAAGADAGADAYIVKGRFDQRVLLEHVARLCGGAR